MARYSFTLYGAGAKYGQLENNRAYYNVNLKALSYDYQTVFLEWTSLLSDPEDVAAGFPPSHWKLVRSTSGSSDSPYEGIVIASDTIYSYAFNAVDTDLEYNAQSIYTFWVFNGRTWINCGSTTVVAVAESPEPTLRKIQKWLPAAWLNDTDGIGDGLGEPENGDLSTVLSAYTFAYDKFRIEAELLEKSVYYKKTPVQLLETKLIDRGFVYEPTLGDSYHRGIYRSSELINSTKGTAPSIVSYVTALTHWGTQVVAGHNLLLNYNDSSFEESVGNWATSTGTFSHVHYASALATVGVAVTPPSSLNGLVTFNTNATFAPRQTGFAWLHAHGNTGALLSLPHIPLYKTTPNYPHPEAVKYGIPVEEFKTYIFTGWARCKEANKTGTVTATILWYDLNGSIISVTADGPTLTTSIAFAKFSSVTATAPDGAKYAAINITLINNANQTEFMFDMFQFALYTGSYEFQDARKVLVYVDGDKTNLVRNPSFESNTNYWTPLNGSLTKVNNPVTWDVFGSKTGKLTVAADGTAAVVSEWIPVDQSENYIASAYVAGSSTGLATLRLEFSQLQSVEDQTKILVDEQGTYYPTSFYYIDSDPIELTTTPQRLDLFAVAPLFSKDAGSPSAKLSIYVTDATSGDILYVDNVQLEDGSSVTTYFDGSGAVLPEDPINSEFIPAYECFWEDETNTSGRSYRWNNYYNKLQVLAETLPLVMPLGVSWEIRSGFATPAYPELTPNVLPSPSFELSTTGWNGDHANIARVVSRGSLFDEYTTHGVAFGTVTSTANQAFGIYSDGELVTDVNGYYTSVALKPENEDAYGTYVLSVTYYDETNIQIIEKTSTMQITNKDRWAFMAVHARRYELSGAYKAVVRVTCTPNTPGSGIVFYIDRVVFRE